VPFVSHNGKENPIGIETALNPAFKDEKPLVTMEKKTR